MASGPISRMDFLWTAFLSKNLSHRFVVRDFELGKEERVLAPRLLVNCKRLPLYTSLLFSSGRPVGGLPVEKCSHRSLPLSLPPPSPSLSLSLHLSLSLSYLLPGPETILVVANVACLELDTLIQS